MKLNYRRATSHDQAFLWEMLYHAIYVPAGSPLPAARYHLPSQNWHAMSTRWGKPHDLGIIALVHVNIPIGAAWLRLLTGTNRGYGYVDDRTPELSIAVLPDYRGKGTGAALLERLFAAARKRYPGISLSVSSANPARRLYERAGFVPVASPGDSITMLKTF
jgi:GNAT superfamily N-acetyltransferase